VLDRQPINQGLVQSVRLVGEYRGKQTLFKQQSSQVLEALRETAVIQSTVSSNRIEGVVAPLERIRELVAHRTTPANRSEQEIAGYREVDLGKNDLKLVADGLPSGCRQDPAIVRAGARRGLSDSG